jgi:hypothetical protein
MSDNFPASNHHPIVYFDSIHAAGLHNGNVRLLATRFDADGKAIPAVEIILPQPEVKNLIVALQKISR